MIRKLIFSCLPAMLVSSLFGAFPIKHKECSVSAADFKANYFLGHPAHELRPEVKHASNHALIRFDVLQEGNGVDVYYGGFEGILYRYSWKDKAVTQIHDFETLKGGFKDYSQGGDHGLLGIYFHPNFKNNRWVFFFYTPKIKSSNDNRVMLISRFEMTTDHKIINEKVLMRIEASNSDRYHSGGDGYFAANGDLFVQVGDNVVGDEVVGTKNRSAAWAAGGTTNYLGGIIRIHPDSSDVGYSVPKNNFGEYFAPIQKNDGYLDTSRVKPEIFAKGQRSNFTSTGHPTKLIHIWGEVNTASLHDEVNVVTHPVFGGWPWYQGNQTSLSPKDPKLPTPRRTGISWTTSGSTILDSRQTTRWLFTIHDAPQHTAEVSGKWIDTTKDMGTLPFAYEADQIMGLDFNVVSAQALYYYGAGDSIWTGRTFPPNFHETFMVSSWKATNTRIVPIYEKDGDWTFDLKDKTYDVQGLFAGGSLVPFRGMSDAKYGPDGALYILARGGGQYGKGVKSAFVRVDYSGTCNDPALFATNQQKYKAAAATASDPTRFREGFYSKEMYTSVYKKDLEVYLTPGERLTANVYGVSGKLLGSFKTLVSSSGEVPEWNGNLNGKQTGEGVYMISYRGNNGKVFNRKQVF